LRCVEPPAGSFAAELQHALEPFRGGRCPVLMVYRGASAAARLQLGERWRVRPSLELLHRLGGLIGPENVRMEYGASGGSAGEGAA
jgi:DNA polymerase-3 subunit alpha